MGCWVPCRPFLFGRKDSESFGGTIISNTAESGPGDTPLARYSLDRQHLAASEIDTLGRVADAPLSCHAGPQELPGGHHLASVLPPGYTGEPTSFSVRTQGQQGSCVLSSGHVSDLWGSPTLLL